MATFPPFKIFLSEIMYGILYGIILPVYITAMQPTSWKAESQDSCLFVRSEEPHTSAFCPSISAFFRDLNCLTSKAMSHLGKPGDMAPGTQ